MKETRARFLLGIGLPVAAIAVTLVPYLAVRSDLPDRLATHFDGSGVPDGSMTPAAFLAFTLAFVIAGGAVCLWLARAAKALPASVAPIAGFLGGFFAGLGSGIALVTFIGQRELEVWTEASAGWSVIMVPLVVSALAGALAARAALALPVAAFEGSVESQPTMKLAPNQHAVWATTMHSRWLAILGAALTIVGVIVAMVTMWWWLLVPSLLIGLIVLSLATLQVRADGTGLHVKYGLLPWPRTKVEVKDMDTATVIDVRPMEWGGWGYRGSLKLMKQAAVVHRAGPGIRLDLHDGRVFVVTVDDPATPVALLNAEIARAAQPASA